MTNAAPATISVGDGSFVTVGQVLVGKYRVERLLGEGGMGAVYQGVHVHMKKRVAVKMLHPEMGRIPEVVARFERALEERPEDMLSLSGICAAIGVAQRTLNLACLEFLGEGPVRYARNRRLDLVRAELLASDPIENRVTGAAMRYGFWELGRFAQAYRLRFGERPSETLRRDVH